jgi:hypothetical protein
LFVFCLISLNLLVAACSEKAGCLVADSRREINVIAVGNGGYSLFLTTSGFHEKAHFY